MSKKLKPVWKVVDELVDECLKQVRIEKARQRAAARRRHKLFGLDIRARFHDHEDVKW